MRLPLSAETQFDGDRALRSGAVLIRGDETEAVGPALSPIEALRAGTSTAASCLGMQEEAGRLAPGYKADVVAVAGDATANAGLLRKPEKLRAVLLDGKFVVREATSTDE